MQSLGEHRLPGRMFVIHHNLVETAAAQSQILKIKIVDGLGANSGEGLPLAHHLNWELLKKPTRKQQISRLHMVGIPLFRLLLNTVGK